MIYDDNSAEFGVNLIAYIRAEMGLGTAARGVAMALEAADIPFNIINFEYSNPGHHRDDSWRHKEVDRSSYDFTVFALNPDNLSNAATRVQRELTGDRYRIGYWFWELPEIPDAWLESFSLVNEVWAASRFVQDAISLKSPLPVFRVPLAIRLGPTNKFSRRHFGLPLKQFLFLSLSDTHSELERKNPLAAICAFKKAFPGDNKRVGLVVKISNADSVHADHKLMARVREETTRQRNIYLLERNMTREEIDALLAVCNCFVSLHRSEGFGLGPAEAMSLGKPVILTNWSGNLDYMTPRNSVAIDYELVPLGKQYGPYSADQIWAQPDLEQAAAWMKKLANEPDLARQIGKLGQETIRNQFSPEAVGKVIRDRLVSLHKTGLGSHVNNGASVPADNVMVRTRSAPTPVCLTIYAADSTGYTEDLALHIPYQMQRWSHLHIALEHGLGVERLRLDPMSGTGLVDIAGLAIRSAIGGEVLWKATARGGLEALETAGSAMTVPHPRLARVFSYGEDPQIFLPLLAGPDFDGPLRLEIWLKLETEAEPIRDAMAELTRASMAARAQLGSANLLLEDRERESAARQEEILRLSETLKGREGELGHARGRIEALEIKVNQAQQELLLRTEEILGLSQTLKGREGELGEARGRIEALEIEVKRDQHQLLSLTKSLSERESELQSKRNELALKKQELAATNADLERVQTHLFLAQRQSADQERAVDESTREMALQRKQLDEGAKELAATTFELAKVSGELAVLKRQRLAQQGVIDELRKKRAWEVLNPLPALQHLFHPKRDQVSPESDMAIDLPRKLEETFWLEHPTGPTLAGETIVVSGWVVTPSGERIDGVQATVNGDTTSGVHGLERADVGAAHRGKDDYFHSGFMINLTLPAGLHEISLQSLTRSGDWDTFCTFLHEVQEGTNQRRQASEVA